MGKYIAGLGLLSIICLAAAPSTSSKSTPALSKTPNANSVAPIDAAKTNIPAIIKMITFVLPLIGFPAAGDCSAC